MERPLALALSLVVHLLTTAFLLFGGWVIAAHADAFLAWPLGGLLVAIAWWLRPRLPRLPADAEVLDRSTAPELYGAAERIAARIGARPPARIAVLDLVTETRFERMGALRTPTLAIGLPLWLALTPKQRVALLARAYADSPTLEERTVETALASLAEWRQGLMHAPPAETREAREDAHAKIAAATVSIEHVPSTTYETAGIIGRLVGRVVGWPVVLYELALRRASRAGQGRIAASRRGRALRVVDERELRELEELIANGGYLAPIQAAALRGESVEEIRLGALSRSAVLTGGGDGELLALAESDRIDAELLKHYTRAIRGFGLITG